MKSMVEVTAGTQGQESTGPASANWYIGKSALIYTNSGFGLDITSIRKAKNK